MTTEPIRRNLDAAAALLDLKAAYVARNPKSAALHEEASALMPGGNTRTVLFYAPFPLAMVRGRDARVWDADGHDYADFLGEYSAGLYGHSHPVILAAIERTLRDGLTLGAHNALEARLAAAIRARFASMELLRFTNSGTEANLMAISAARAVTGRRKVMVFEGAYHGAVFSFGGVGGATSPVNAPFDFLVAPYNDVDQAQALIDQHGPDIAVVAVEPMLGAGGCIPAEPAFLKALRRATERHGTLLLFDEVMTSRLAPGGLQEVHGIRPDLTTIGKYIGGGMSFGAFGGRAEIMARFDPRRPDAWAHAGTFNNNVLSMAAGLAGLTEVFTPDAVAALNRGGDALRERLNEIFHTHRVGMQFTGRGSLMTAHVRGGPIRSQREAADSDPALKELLFFHLLSQGVYLARRGMVTLSLPLTAEDRRTLVDGVESFVGTYRDLLPEAEPG